MKTLLSPVTAVTCDADFRVIEDAALHIENGRICYVGPRAEAPAFQPDETVGGAHLVALPGLVNTHTHAAMTLVRGYADDMALEPWLHEKIWPYEANLRAHHVYKGTQLAIAEMVRGGTTCFADMYFFYEEGTRAMIESGIRAAPSAVLLGFLPDAEEKIGRGIEWANAHKTPVTGASRPIWRRTRFTPATCAQWQQIVVGRARTRFAHRHSHQRDAARKRRCEGAVGRHARCSRSMKSARSTARCWRRTASTPTSATAKSWRRRRFLWRTILSRT